jgi:hypothetical protein
MVTLPPELAFLCVDVSDGEDNAHGMGFAWHGHPAFVLRKGRAMSIQSVTSLYSRVGSASAPQLGSLKALSDVAWQAVASSGSASGDDSVVTISSTARQLGETGLPAWVYEQMEKLRANPDQNEAMQRVEWRTIFDTSSPLFYYNPDSDGVHGRVYVYTGELSTPEDMQRYTKMIQTSSAKTAEIFRTEKAKGTPAAEILEKTQRYMATLPDDFLRVVGWYDGWFV